MSVISQAFLQSLASKGNTIIIIEGKQRKKQSLQDSFRKRLNERKKSSGFNMNRFSVIPSPS
jgi:hypothetical protein